MTRRQEVAAKLQEFIDAAGRLRGRHRTSAEWALWEDEVYRYLRREIDQQAATDFHNKMHAGFSWASADASQEDMRFVDKAVVHLQVVKARVDRGEYDAESPGDLVRPATPRSVFIAHSGEPAALFRLRRFLEALGVRPVIAEWLPFRGQQVPDHARSSMDGCDAAIVFATAADAVGERRQPGRGLFTETGILQERFGEKVIYLVEEGVELGPMLDSYAREFFTQECLERAFYRVVVELKEYEII
jgi:predicted nucleotide-binding protein